jgi:hypothetical protein
VHKVTRSMQPSTLAVGLELPRQAALLVEQRDLAVNDALLTQDVGR